MKTQTLLPLTATLLFAACTGAMLMSARHPGTVSVPAADATAIVAAAAPAMRIVDLPAVVVHADPANAPRIVDLPTITVHADPSLAEASVLAQEPAIVDLPTVTVRAEPVDATTTAPVIAVGLPR